MYLFNVMEEKKHSKQAPLFFAAEGVRIMSPS